MKNYYIQLIVGNPLIVLYLTSVFVDIVLGNIKAWSNGDVDSTVGLKGTIKHLGMMTFIMMFLPALSFYMGTNTIKVAIITYVVYQYGISIIENLHALGFEMPDWISDGLRRLHEEKLDEVEILKGLGLDDKETKDS